MGISPVAIVAGDFTGDGRTDLAVVNIGSNDVSILLGNGDGTFQNRSRTRWGRRPTPSPAADFNGDQPHRPRRRQPLWQQRVGAAGQRRRHLPDQLTYAVGRTQSPSWRVTSTATAAPTWPSQTSGTSTVSVLLGNGDGTFQHQVTYAVGSHPDAIVAGDFNGDGRTDLAVANEGDNTCRCCWATATARSRTRSLTRWGRAQSPS